MTTRAQIKQVEADLDHFLRECETIVRSFSPVGLGAEFKKDEDVCIDCLATVRFRFRSMLARAKRKGWPES